MKTYEDFMCIHSPEEEARCNDLMARAYSELRCKPEDFLTAVVFGFEDLPDVDGQSCYARLTGMSADQWCAVGAEVVIAGHPGYGDVPRKDAEVIANVYVQCDRVEHGLARLYELSVQAANEYQL